MPLTRPRNWQLLDSDFKESVRAATTTAVTLTAAPTIVDGVSLAKRDRVLVKNQTNGAENGIYYVQTLGTGANGVWVRAPDFMYTENVTAGVQVLIEEGGVNGDKVWQLTTDNPIVLGTTALTWQVASGGGTLDSVTDGGNTTTNDITVGNLFSTGNVTGSRLISNVATGTSPIVVTSTTPVANLSVATAGSATTAGTVTTNAQPNITSVGTLTSLTATGAITGSQVISTIATGTAPLQVASTTRVANLNVANAGYADSAGTAGTVTTAAQPNITSVGTLTSLAVNGTITGTRLISNIATGTAPLQVTSTTQVANLNVATSGTAITFNTTTDETTNALEYPVFVGASGASQAGNVAPNKLSFNPSTGTFSAVTKSFVIDHPSKAGMKLHYGCLESPYHGVRLTGEGKLEGNLCKVILPDYIKDLCKQEGSTVQLTNIKHGRTMWVDEINVSENYFTIGCEGYAIDPLRFYWSFTAIRKDVPDIEVEY